MNIFMTGRFHNRYSKQYIISSILSHIFTYYIDNYDVRKMLVYRLFHKKCSKIMIETHFTWYYILSATLVFLHYFRWYDLTSKNENTQSLCKDFFNALYMMMMIARDFIVYRISAFPCWLRMNPGIWWWVLQNLFLWIRASIFFFISMQNYIDN